MIWFTSDLHFGHQAVIEYCDRPFQFTVQMHEQLVKRWNAKVKPTDMVYVLGDLALCKFSDAEPWIKQLNGTKILVKGNHDHYSNAQYGKMGFIMVVDEIKLKLAGHTLRLSHYPPALPWWRRLFAYKSELRFMERRPPVIKGEIIVHGHTHTKKKLTDNRFHIGVDAWNYGPVSQYEIEALLNARRKTPNG